MVESEIPSFDFEVLPNVPIDQREEGRIYESIIGVPVMHINNGSRVQIDFLGERTHLLAELTHKSLAAKLSAYDAAAAMRWADVTSNELLNIFEEIHFDVDKSFARADHLCNGLVPSYKVWIDTDDGHSYCYFIPAYCVWLAPESPIEGEEKES